MQYFVLQGIENPLKIIRVIELPSDDKFDDISLQLLKSSDGEVKINGII